MSQTNFRAPYSETFIKQCFGFSLTFQFSETLIPHKSQGVVLGNIILFGKLILWNRQASGKIPCFLLYFEKNYKQYQITIKWIKKLIIYYSRVPNKRTGAFNRTGEKKQPNLINVQYKTIVKKGITLSKLINVQD